MVNYPILLLNDHISYFHMYYKYLFSLQEYMNNAPKNKFGNFWNKKTLIETIVSEFKNSYQQYTKKF